MPKHLLATAAMLLALGGPALAQEQSAAGAADAKSPTTEVQNEQTTAPPGEIAPDPKGAGSATGGVTATGREMLPDNTTETPVDAEELESADSPEIDPSAQPGAGRANVVSQDVVQELRRMALEQEKKTSKPAAPKTEAQKQAEQKAIAAHRDALFARIEERS